MEEVLRAVDLTLEEVEFLFESVSHYEQKFRIETPAPIANNINDVRAKLIAILHSLTLVNAPRLAELSTVV